jgi:hypothetical protein
MRDDEPDGHFVVMVAILFLLSTAVLLLFGGSALNTHAAIR